MGLKTLLRGWLGVDKIESDLQRVDGRVIDRTVLRKEIADAFEFVLAGDRGDRYFLWGQIFPDEGKRLEDLVRRVTGEQAAGVAASTVNARIGGEKFIDEVVERIRRKQLAVKD